MLSENIREQRMIKNMTQEDLAQKVYTSRQTISKYEKGISIPDAEMLLLLAKALDVKVTVLLDEKEEDEAYRKIEERLKDLNETLGQRNHRFNRILKIVKYIFIGIIIYIIFISFFFSAVNFV